MGSLRSYAFGQRWSRPRLGGYEGKEDGLPRMGRIYKARERRKRESHEEPSLDSKHEAEVILQGENESRHRIMNEAEAGDCEHVSISI